VRAPLTIAAVLALCAGTVVLAQFDPDKVIPGGGVFLQGWTGKVDASSARQGRKLEDAKLAQDGSAIRATTGPATTFWNPANTAKGDYTIKASFLEPKFMELNNHPHSYGIFIGGNDMGTDKMSLVYCAAYGDGTAFVRGFGPAVFNMLRAQAFPSVGKAAGVGQPVKQDIAWTVKGAKAECSINGAVIASYTSDQLVAAGKLTSLDGVYGIRLTHNVDTIITGFGKS
jgi:hypothetical protein